MPQRKDSFIGSVTKASPIPPITDVQQQVVCELRLLYSNFVQNPKVNILSQKNGSSKIIEILQILETSEEPAHPSLVLILRELLFLVEYYEGMTKAHQFASEIVIKEVKLVRNRSHDLSGQVNSVNASKDDRFLATGNCAYNPNSRIDYPASIQIWELCTGRCINKIPADCGFNCYGLLHWNQTYSDSPLEQRYHIALNTETNGIQAYDAFSSDSKGIYGIVSHEENNRPCGWSWCPEDRCIISFGVVACLYDNQGNFSPEKEYSLPEEYYQIDEKLPCPHFKKLSLAERKVEIDLIGNNIQIEAVPPLTVLVEKFIVKSGYVTEIRNFPELPDVLVNSLFSLLISTYQSNVHNTHLPPTPKSKKRTNEMLASLSYDKSTFVFEANLHLMVNSKKKKKHENPNVPTHFVIWKNVSNKFEFFSLDLDFSPYCISVSPHGTKLAVTHFPDLTGYKTDVWLIQRSPLLLCTISHPLHPKPVHDNQVDPHYRYPILWANAGDFDSSLYYIYYNQEGAQEAPEKLFVWNSFTGQLIGNWVRFHSELADLPAPSEHPLRYYQENEEDEEEEVKQEDLLFTGDKDPFFFYFCPSRGYWCHVAAFDSGLVVFSEEFPEEDFNCILKYDLSFVLWKQLAWPAHWCVGTSVLEISIGWTDARNRYTSCLIYDNICSPKLFPTFPKLRLTTIEEEEEEREDVEAYHFDRGGETVLMEPQLHKSRYEPDKSTVFTASQLEENPSILEPWLGNSLFIEKIVGDDKTELIQVTLTKIIPEESKCEFYQYFESGGGLYTLKLKFDEIIWVSLAKVKLPLLHRHWIVDRELESDSY